MKRSRFNEEQIIGILREAEATSVKGVCAKHNISDATYYNWKRKYGGMEVDEARRLRALEEENGRLKRLVADQAADTDPEGGKLKKMVSPSSRRGAVKYVVEEGLGSAAQACRAVELARSSYYLRLKPQRSAMKERIIELSHSHPRYGYRRISALLHREGERINPKRLPN